MLFTDHNDYSYLSPRDVCGVIDRNQKRRVCLVVGRMNAMYLRIDTHFFARDTV